MSINSKKGSKTYYSFGADTGSCDDLTAVNYIKYDEDGTLNVLQSDALTVSADTATTLDLSQVGTLTPFGSSGSTTVDVSSRPLVTGNVTINPYVSDGNDWYTTVTTTGIFNINPIPSHNKQKTKSGKRLRFDRFFRHIKEDLHFRGCALENNLFFLISERGEFFMADVGELEEVTREIYLLKAAYE